jgi:uncharacterized protein
VPIKFVTLKRARSSYLYTDLHDEEMHMALQVSAIMLGVDDVARARDFYVALGCEVDKDFPNFVSFQLGEGDTSLALYERAAAAEDAGVSAEGSGFRGVSFHYIVADGKEVDEVLGKVPAAGGTIVKEAEASEWGGSSAYFSDPDGHLWKIAAS